MIISLIACIFLTLSSSIYGMETTQAVIEQNPYAKYYGQDIETFNAWDKELEYALTSYDEDKLKISVSNVLNGIRIIGRCRILKENNTRIQLICIDSEMSAKSGKGIIFELIDILTSPLVSPSYEKTGYPAFEEAELQCFLEKAIRPRMLELHKSSVVIALELAAQKGLVKTTNIIFSKHMISQRMLNSINEVILKKQLKTKCPIMHDKYSQVLRAFEVAVTF